ncbi:hypothetical protein TALC_00792 [Thermoplasmatales archaeon BRNA1]|nr:hypothetical protein TALC_00792 [Thermoplasmatales archaeon BRNA1]
MGNKGCTKHERLQREYEMLSGVRDQLVFFREMYSEIYGSRSKNVDSVIADTEYEMSALREEMGVH